MGSTQGMVIIDKYFPNLSQIQRERFDQLGALYADWNAQINVISRKDMDAFYERHVLHSLAIAKVRWFDPGMRILDVGTGGGFPGIPLAILFPETHFHLVDSIGKKIKVVQEVADALDLKNVLAEQKRAEKLKGPYDYVISRAVTRMPRFLAWTRKKLTVKTFPAALPSGILYLKGGDLSEEMAGIEHRHFDLSQYYEEAFFSTKKVVFVAADTLYP